MQVTYTNLCGTCPWIECEHMIVLNIILNVIKI